MNRFNLRPHSASEVWTDRHMPEAWCLKCLQPCQVYIESRPVTESPPWVWSSKCCDADVTDTDPKEP
jgi:hypothetical protein